MLEKHGLTDAQLQTWDVEALEGKVADLLGEFPAEIRKRWKKSRRRAAAANRAAEEKAAAANSAALEDPRDRRREAHVELPAEDSEQFRTLEQIDRKLGVNKEALFAAVSKLCAVQGSYTKMQLVQVGRRETLNSGHL